MKLHLGRGQQLVEYLLLFAMVIIVLLAFLRPFGYLHQTVNQALDRAVEQINIEANRL